MLELIRREMIYILYYFDIQFRQIAGYWILGMAVGSFVSVFAKEKIHALFSSMQGKKWGMLGVIPASCLGILSPLCMYGTIPIAASFSQKGMRHDWLAAFMMSSVLLNSQLMVYSMALGQTAFFIRLISCTVCGVVAGLLIWLWNGMSMGSAAAFMITGPATKITNLGALKIVLGMKRFMIYILFAMLFAFLTGMLVNGMGLHY